MSQDFAINAINLANQPVTQKKPAYLITLIQESKKDTNVFFITSDAPEFIGNFVKTKGCYSQQAELFIFQNYLTILTNTNKELFFEVYFPVHRISNIKSLLYKAK